MKKPILIWILILTTCIEIHSQQIFDVHIHGSDNISEQLNILKEYGVYKAALSTSWFLEHSYKDIPGLKLLKGLMLACPNGKVPYSENFCFENQQDFPEPRWVEENIISGNIDFIGEVLNQYYGITPNSDKLYPYYALAEKYNLPIGFHTGIAGPDHDSPNFKVALGNPMLLEDVLIRFPKLKIWIMHAGAPFVQETIALMKYYSNVYADISVISNPYIFPKAEFQSIMHQLLDAGLENKLMFGTDNGDIKLILENFNSVELTAEQKEKILYKNAKGFFEKQ